VMLIVEPSDLRTRPIYFSINTLDITLFLPTMKSVTEGFILNMPLRETRKWNVSPESAMKLF
jgi:uncharacterized membrane protein